MSLKELTKLSKLSCSKWEESISSDFLTLSIDIGTNTQSSKYFWSFQSSHHITWYSQPHRLTCLDSPIQIIFYLFDAFSSAVAPLVPHLQPPAPPVFVLFSPVSLLFSPLSRASLSWDMPIRGLWVRSRDAWNSKVRERGTWAWHRKGIGSFLW